LINKALEREGNTCSFV